MPYTISIPPFGDLSLEQTRACRHNGNVRLKGGPGTGKSLVSLWRALNSASGERVLILTYTLSLEFYFRQMLKSAQEFGSTKSISIQRSQKTFYNKTWMLQGFYDEIVLDEAQDMEPTHIKTFLEKTNRITFGADFRQQLYPKKGIQENTLLSLIPDAAEFQMQKNYRSTQQILKAVRVFLPEQAIDPQVIAQSSIGAAVELQVAQYNLESSKAFEILQSILPKTNGNIGVLAPNVDAVMELYTALKNLLPQDTTYYTSSTGLDNLSHMGRLHICTYKSSKGLEWDTIILPYFGNRQNLIQGDGPVGLNDHYVAMTRAKNLLILISTKYEDLNLLNASNNQTHTRFNNPNIQINQEVISTPYAPIVDDDLPF